MSRMTAIAATDAATPASGGPSTMFAAISTTFTTVDAGLRIEATVPRDQLWEAQTPQVFRRDVLTKAYARKGTSSATDECTIRRTSGCGRSS